MRFTPQSLFARLLTALLAVIGVTLIVIAFLIMQDRRELTLRVGGVWNTSHRIAEITSSLSTLKGQQRVQELDKLRAQPVMVGQGETPFQRRMPDMSHIADRLAALVRTQLGDDYQVTITPARPDQQAVIRLVTIGGQFRPFQEEPGPHPPAGEPHRLELLTGSGPPPPFEVSEDQRPGGRSGERVSMQPLYDVNVALPDGQSVVFRVTPPWPEPPLPVRIFLELGILTLALGLALYLTTRSITRPLSDLARAADAVGRSVRHPSLEEKGASEIRHATRAFNAMQDRMQRYLDSRTRVLAAMSHDLRTPLTRLRLRMESISDASLRDRFGTDLDEMESLVNGALGLFKGLDDDEGVEPVDIDALLRTVADEFIEMGAKVAVEGRAPEPVAVKPLALKRCITNLLANAVKFGTQATVFVEDGPALVIRVRDDGPGIPPEALEQVFEPFFRLESSRNRDTGGTGLGLSIARDVAQAHGGTLFLHNLPERGLEAVLTIPRHNARR